MTWTKLKSERMMGLLLWSLLPSVAIWLGLYVLKSAVWAYVLYHGVFLVPAIILGRSLWLPSFRLPHKKDCVIVVVTAIVFCIVTVIGYEIAGSFVLSHAQVGVMLKEQGILKENLWLFGVYAVIVNPLFEEIFWRGIVLNALDNLRLPWKHFGIIWSSAAYALLHYLIFRLVLFPIYAELGIILLATYGALLAMIYRRTGSVITTAMVHGLFTDLACILLIYDFFRQHPGP